MSSKEKEKKGGAGQVIRQMAAGSLARATAGTILIPIDTCKTRLQFMGSNKTSVKQYKGFIDCFVTIYKEEGITAFYRGLPARLLYIVPAAGVSFAVYEWAKRLLTNPEKSSNFEIAAPFIAGSMARFIATTVKIPFDVVKQRLEVQGAILEKTAENYYSGTWDAFKKIATKEGFARGLWTGFTITLLRDVPFAATYFTSYELSKAFQKQVLQEAKLMRTEQDLNTANHLIAGATAGCAASIVTMPIDAIKTRVQTDVLTRKKDLSGNNNNLSKDAVKSVGNSNSSPKKRGILEVSEEIFQKDGYKGFYRGLTPRLVSIIPSASITFAAYEAYKKLLGV
jgi:solute carrier family 25 iron transporter 28/37